MDLRIGKETDACNEAYLRMGPTAGEVNEEEDKRYKESSYEKRALSICSKALRRCSLRIATSSGSLSRDRELDFLSKTRSALLTIRNYHWECGQKKVRTNDKGSDTT